ncbi:hypothetical protein H310_08002 [Aphanomyces invadans]|uniref:Rab-GAP TBC domain-containing protein n=1 Tax=Aphanomyces invadans TaxID=157072 RepID=A0A024TZ15_9STRA|nr:hypothetical protein H310_08002 [Aphanomyces invadans]ETV99258.1 hypothetical protein H310_08002 [Aphanomyces invadans]|eukprot:XP_008871814.1 hypothetical protein H310_08002 [Aphanomyces invadans]
MPRNFRKTYYKSLGVHSAEVEDSFAALLGQDTPAPALTINLTQLVRLTLEFGLPSMYRRQMWWVVTAIVPLARDADSWQYARMEKRAIYNDVAMAAECCVPDVPLHASTSKHVLRVLRFYVDQVRPHLNTSFAANGAVPSDQGFDWILREESVADSVASAVSQVMNDDPSDQFWCLLAFLGILDRGFFALQPPMPIQDLHDVSPGTLELLICRILAAVAT